MPSSGYSHVEAAPVEADPLLGSRIQNRYRVVERVAIGGMASVYRAVELASSEEVAIKVVAAAALADPVTLKRFDTEVAIIATLRHPATLKLRGYGTLADGRPFLVTEFLHGVSFEDALLSHPFRPAEVLSVLLPICDALGEAHTRGIVHRDLKPENIFLQDIGGGRTRVRILDFGIAKLSHSHHTQAGSICGTPAYMSPEQAQGYPADPRSDVYGLGVLAYRALVGRPPFDGEEPMSILLKQIREPPVPLRQALNRPDLPHELERLVMAMLEKSPSRRPASTYVVKSHIQHLLTGTPWRSRPRRRIEPWHRWMSRGLGFAGWSGSSYRLAGVTLIGLALSIVVATWLSRSPVHANDLESVGIVVDPIDPPLESFDDLPPLPIVSETPEEDLMEARSRR